MGNSEKKVLGFEFEVNTKEKLRVQPSSIAFAFFAATIPLYSPNMGILDGFMQGGNFVGFFVFPLLVAALVTSLITLVYSSKHWNWQCFGLRSLGLAALSYCAGLLLFFVLVHFPTSFYPLAVCAGILSGCGMVPLCVAWGTHFSMPLRNVVLWGAVICFASSILGWLLCIVPRELLWVIYPLVIVVGAATPVWKLYRGTLHFPKSDNAHESQATIEKRGALTGIKRILSIIWLPFSALMVYAFLTSVHKLYVFEMLDSEFLGGALAALLIIPLCFVKTDKPLILMVYKIIIPVFAAVLIVLGSFPVASTPQFIGTVGVYVFFIFLALFAMASLVAVTDAGEFPPTFIYSFALICGTVVTLFGLVQAQLFTPTDDFWPILWVITCLYFAVIMVYLGISSWKGYSPEEASNSVQETLHARCEALAERCKLSERESEILEYMSRGYSPTYIAKTLVISVSTARSHVRNIYRKVGIGSREELLQLIDAEQV